MFPIVHRKVSVCRYHRVAVALDRNRLILMSRFNDRGCRLEWTRMKYRVNGGVRPGVAINAPSWITEQLEPELRRRGAQRVRVAGSDWLDHYAFPGPLDGTLLNLLDQLATVMSIGRKPSGLDHCFALDFYKRPVDDLDSMQWPNTEAGDLVYRSKYWSGDASQQAFSALVMRMAAFLRGHPLLAASSCVVSIPGRIGSETGHGERLAREVAAASGKSFHHTRALYEEREAAKEGSRLRMDQVEVHPVVFIDDIVIIVDDVMRSGGSMSAVAASARAQGAIRVYGLAAAKTLRN
jgi:hypothetical protein